MSGFLGNNASNKVNPYASCGNIIVDGNRFVGREQHIRTISDIVFPSGGFGSVWVQGMPRVGKSSLVAQAIRVAPIGECSRIVYVLIDVSTQYSSAALFRQMLSTTNATLIDKGLSREPIRDWYSRLILLDEISYSDIAEYFERVRANDVRVVCVLDEFDTVRTLFDGAQHLFYWIKVLAQNAFVAFIIISKRSLGDIARSAGLESNYWANVLHRILLKPFDEIEVDKFFERLDESLPGVDDRIREITMRASGCVPYLLEKAAFYLHQHSTSGVTANWYYEQYVPFVSEYYESLVTVLNQTEKLRQILIGPQYNVTKRELDALIDYGVIVRVGGTVAAFADDFVSYLDELTCEQQFWPLWCQTECGLRDAITRKLVDLFGCDWVPAYLHAYPGRKNLVTEFQSRRDRLSRRGEAPLLRYAYPMELYSVMAANWSVIGNPILGRDTAYWDQKFQALTTVRNSVAHNNGEILQEFQIRAAEAACHEIIEKLHRL